MASFVTCLTTVGSQRIGERIARRLVERRLAACVNVVPGVVSFYHWKKKLCRETEVILMMKTTKSKIPSLEKELRHIHPYELPEFIVLPIIKGSTDYLKWLETEVKL
jgi:periplasmic divalent cation tolerance protein